MMALGDVEDCSVVEEGVAFAEGVVDGVNLVAIVAVTVGACSSCMKRYAPPPMSKAIDAAAIHRRKVERWETGTMAGC
jgi:hypothetical protein